MKHIKTVLSIPGIIVGIPVCTAMAFLLIGAAILQFALYLVDEAIVQIENQFYTWQYRRKQIIV